MFQRKAPVHKLSYFSRKEQTIIPNEISIRLQLVNLPPLFLFAAKPNQKLTTATKGKPNGMSDPDDLTFRCFRFPIIHPTDYLSKILCTQ